MRYASGIQSTRMAALVAVLAYLPLALPAADSGFLSDASKLPAPVAGEGGGTDQIYIAPGAVEGLRRYDSVLIDQPEIFIAANSPYHGAKPDDLQAIAGVVREALIKELKAGGYKIATAPGAGVLYVRPAVTDLSLKKKKRGLLAYTPIGFVVSTGVKAIQDLMQKYDIVGLNLEVELIDSTSNQLLAAAALKRGAMKDKAAGTKDVRLSFNDFEGMVGDYSGRLRCRLDNAKVAKDQQINCLDPAARAARAGKSGS